MGVLILLIISCALLHALRAKVDKETQTLRQLKAVVRRLNNKTAPALMIRMDKKYFWMLSDAQKNVVYNQLECEAREEVHEQLKKERCQVNDSELQKWANNICKHNANLSRPYHRCICNASNDPLFCKIYDFIEKLERKREGPLICKDQLIEHLKSASPFAAEQVLKLNFGIIETAHRIIVQIKEHDIAFRILDDLLSKNTLLELPIDFCGRGYRFSKCLCDMRSSAFFCVYDLIKHMALVYIDEELCGSSSASHLPLFLPILILVAKLL